MWEIGLRYKINTTPLLIAPGLQRQRRSLTFEHALDHRLDRAIDLTALNAHIFDDQIRATA